VFALGSIPIARSTFRHRWPMPANAASGPSAHNRFADVGWHWLWFHTQSDLYDLSECVADARRQCLRSGSSILRFLNGLLKAGA
jgi:hypothetical protein